MKDRHPEMMKSSSSMKQLPNIGVPGPVLKDARNAGVHQNDPPRLPLHVHFTTGIPKHGLQIHQNTPEYTLTGAIHIVIEDVIPVYFGKVYFGN